MGHCDKLTNLADEATESQVKFPAEPVPPEPK